MEVCEVNAKFISNLNRICSSLIAGYSTDVAHTTEEALKLIRRSLKSNSMDRMEGTHFDGTYPHIFVTFGASVRSFE